MDFKDVENVEQFSSIFSKIGDIKISPTTYYDHIELPEPLRATFTIKPYNPIVKEEIKQINKKGRIASNEFLKNKGYDVYELSSDIMGITNLFGVVANAKVDEDRELCDKTAKELIAQIKSRANDLNGLGDAIERLESELGDSSKSDNYDYALLSLILDKLRPINEEQDGIYYASRDLSRLFDILIAHTSHVENLITQGENELVSHTGGFAATELYSLNSDILKWLETQQARESSLSEREIVGL